jgi:nudix-type nucleoside diphosphatase (YffH/AdpP family)
VKCEILTSDTVFDEYVKIEKTAVRWERFGGGMGETSTRYVVRRGDSVGIVPVCMNSGRIVLVKQFRFAALRADEDGFLWEIPAGMLDRGEEPMETAARELYEEIGLNAERFERLISYYLSPGLLDEKMHLFLARIADCRKLNEAGGNPDENEDLLIRSFDRGEILDMIAGQEIEDAKTIAGLLHYFIMHEQGRL